MNKLYYPSFLFLLFILSCASVKNKPITHTTLSKIDFLNKTSNNRINYSFLTIKSKAEINLNGQSFSTPMQIRLKKDSIIWMSITPFMGIEAFRLLIRTDSIFMVNKIEKKSYSMSIDSLKKMLTIPLSIKYLQDLILGDLFVNNKNIKEFTQDSSGYCLSFQEGNITGMGLVSSLNYRLTQLAMKRRNSSDTVTIHYSDFRGWEETSLAHNVLYDINNKMFSGKISLEHYKIEKANPEITFPFSILKEKKE